ncbi:MAG: hypothetical protein ABIR16_08740 [Dokdonella sp.]
MNEETQSLAVACERLESAKTSESEATLTRLSAENAVIALVGKLPDEGTTRFEDGEFIAIVATSIRRTVDPEKLAQIAARGDIPEAIGKRLLRWKPELVTREFRYIELNEPDIYTALVPAIESKPSKPSVKIERAVAQKEAA